MQVIPGSYALILRSTMRESIKVGCLGILDIKPGYYVYVGSAFGPGGVRARVLRHSRCNKARHWHIDYLREIIDLEYAWYSYQPDKLEHDWAASFAYDSEYAAIRGFGCSDCRCDAHLFYSVRPPDFESFKSRSGGSVHIWEP